MVGGLPTLLIGGAPALAADSVVAAGFRSCPLPLTVTAPRLGDRRAIGGGLDEIVGDLGVARVVDARGTGGGWSLRVDDRDRDAPGRASPTERRPDDILVSTDVTSVAGRAPRNTVGYPLAVPLASAAAAPGSSWRRPARAWAPRRSARRCACASRPPRRPAPTTPGSRSASSPAPEPPRSGQQSAHQVEQRSRAERLGDEGVRSGGQRALPALPGRPRRRSSRAASRTVAACRASRSARCGSTATPHAICETLSATELARLDLDHRGRGATDAVPGDLRVSDASEAGGKRSLAVFQGWKPAEGADFKGFYGFADGSGGAAVVEVDGHATLARITAPFMPWLRFTAKPILPIQGVRGDLRRGQRLARLHRLRPSHSTKSGSRVAVPPGRSQGTEPLGTRLLRRVARAGSARGSRRSGQKLRRPATLFKSRQRRWPVL